MTLIRRPTIYQIYNQHVQSVAFDQIGAFTRRRPPERNEETTRREEDTRSCDSIAGSLILAADNSHGKQTFNTIQAVLTASGVAMTVVRN